MKWEHKVDIEWMRERQRHLCASDIKKLIPYTASGRAKKITDEDRMRILSNKLKFIGPDECMSTGAAARGHILEPFAIEDLNAHLSETGCDLRFHHWDDVVIAEDKPMGLSFSPDGMNFAMDTSDRLVKAGNIHPNTKIVEVKSYSTEKHMMCGMTDKMKLEERWQIATAMETCWQIYEALLLFYDPSCMKKIFVKRYTRLDLETELDIINDVRKDWLDFINRSKLLDMDSDDWNNESSIVIDGNSNDMDEIRKKIESMSRLNP